MARLYYLSHWLYQHRIPLLPRVLMLLIRLVYGSYIPYRIRIGKNVNFGHKFGIVLNENAVIGDNVRIRHGVTLGSGKAVIGDNVDIGAGAKIIGSVRIGNGAKIGANAVVVKDIPDNCTAVGVPARIIPPKQA